MARDTLTDGFARQRRRLAALAAALLLLVSAYAGALNLSSGPAQPTVEARADALLASFILAAISAAGIGAAARPSDCFGLLSRGRRTRSSAIAAENPEGATAFPLVAHHCSCGRFADHILAFGDRTYCAGCLGMAAGGACSIGLAVPLGAGLLFLDHTFALAATLLGATASALGLVQLYRPTSAGMHAAANLVFVAGAAFLAALLSVHGLAAGAFGLLTTLALVGLRIEMSRWRHLSIYAECPWTATCRGATGLAAARRATRQ